LSPRAVATRGAPAAVPELPHPRELIPSLPVAEATHWYACGAPPAGTRQGWKLYVPMTMLNARDLTECLVPLAFDAGLHFKYVKSIKTLRKLNAGIYGYPQIGKCFVIYLPNLDATFLATLKDVLRPYRDQCPAVPCARSFGDRLPLYYRFGPYDSSMLVFDHAEIQDDRSSLANAVPEGVLDVLAPFTSPEASDPRVDRFLRRYPIFRAIVQQGKCGVFHAMDLASETFREVVLKAGYHRGQLQADGTDGCDFLRRELACYQVLAQRGLDPLAPTLVDALDVPRKVILVLQHIDGVSLLRFKLSGRLTVKQLERAWAMIELFHAGGVYLGDAKLANFLTTPDDDLRAVDFEAGGVIGDQAPPVRTFFIDSEPDDPRAADRAHFLASVLYPYEEGRYSWEDRYVNLRAWLRQEPDDEVSAWALERLRGILDAS
jgi:hypothetical protein